MRKRSSFLKKVLILFLILVAGLFLGWYLWPEGELSIETEEVIERDVVEEVTGTARVAANVELDLAFEVAGVITEILVEEGDRVESGQELARLDTDLLRFELDQAEANILAQEAKLEELETGITLEELEAARSAMTAAEVSLNNANDQLTDVKKREEERVRDAKEDLLTTDIQAKFAGKEVRPDIRNYQPPIIGGVFQGLEPEKYEITIYSSMSPSGYSLRWENRDGESGGARVSDSAPQSFGGEGLNIVFPSNFARHRNVKWEVEIPNTNSPKYPKLKQAHNNALENKERAVNEAKRQVKDSQAAYDRAYSEFVATKADTRPERIKAQEAALRQAESSLMGVRVRLDKATLRSPVDGKVHVKHLSVGENVSPGAPVFSVAGNDVPYLSIYIPEVDVANLEVGDKAVARFDALPQVRHQAKVFYVSSVGVEREGVSNFKSKLKLIDSDPRIRTGMTADLDIVTLKRSQVPAVPGRAILRKDDGYYVRVVDDLTVEYRKVERGLRGNDGWVEIIGGVEIGEKVIVYVDEDDLEQLKIKNDR